MTIIQKKLEEIRVGDIVCMDTEVCVAISNPKTHDMWERIHKYCAIGRNAFGEEVELANACGHSTIWDIVIVDDGDFFYTPNAQEFIAGFAGTDDCVLASLKYTDNENIIDIKLVFKAVESNTEEPVLVYEFELKCEDTHIEDTLLFELENISAESVMLNMLDVCRLLIYEI